MVQSVVHRPCAAQVQESIMGWFTCIDRPDVGLGCGYAHLPPYCGPLRNYVQWHRGDVGRVLDLRSRGRGFESRPGMQRKNSGQVSHTYVTLFTKQYKLVPAKGR